MFNVNFLSILLAILLCFACDDDKKTENTIVDQSIVADMQQTTADMMIVDQNMQVMDMQVMDMQVMDMQVVDMMSSPMDMGSIADRFKLVAGPPPSDFDCSADFQRPAQRVSPNPISCIIDPSCEGKMVVGHRGVGGDLGHVAPENSLFAIRAAMLMGLDGVELDVQETIDDQLILMHDSDVDRTTTSTGNVNQMTLEQVKSLQVKPQNNMIRGDFSCAKVPTLAEALALTKDHVFIILDVKTDRMDLVVKAIQDADMRDQVMISVGAFEKAVVARMIDPTVRVQVRPDSVAEFEDYLMRLTPPAEIQEIPLNLVTELAPRIHELNLKAFSDTWAMDVRASVSGDSSVYLEPFNQGLNVIQCELPTHALRALGRWTGE